MNNERIRKAFVIFVALVGALLNAYYGYEFVRAFLDSRTDFGTRQILAAVITLEFAWMALLLWVILKPFQRRAILLFAGAAILAGNVLVGTAMLMEPTGSWSAFFMNLLVGLVFFAFFIAAYFVGKPLERSEL
jgi:hypothetical protein